jgi:hypothetical protein
MYDLSDKLFETYLKILREELRSFLNFDFYYQSQITTRIQTPHKSAKSFYPFFHSDIQLGHPPFMINVWIPLTELDASEKHGFALASLCDSMEVFSSNGFEISSINANRSTINNRLAPFAVSPTVPAGSVMLFDARKFHSTLPLKDHTRASIDVRLMPAEIAANSANIYKGLGRRKIEFSPGKAYSAESIDALL